MTGQMTKIGLAASAISIIASIYIYFSDGGDPMLGFSLDFGRNTNSVHN